MTRASHFRQTDVTKFLKAARDAGAPVRRVIQSPNGEIHYLFSDDKGDLPDRTNDFDAEYGGE